jgi:hypothetical protein
VRTEGDSVELVSGDDPDAVVRVLTGRR